MWFNEKERVALTVFGALLLTALGILLWQRQRPTLVVEPAPEQTVRWDQALASARQIDVNTANVAELERLPGVGPTLAKRIVDYRSAHGRFQSPDDLQQVQGIGPKTYETLREYATVE